MKLDDGEIWTRLYCTSSLLWTKTHAHKTFCHPTHLQIPLDQSRERIEHLTLVRNQTVFTNKTSVHCSGPCSFFYSLFIETHFISNRHIQMCLEQFAAFRYKQWRRKEKQFLLVEAQIWSVSVCITECIFVILKKKYFLLTHSTSLSLNLV